MRSLMMSGAQLADFKDLAQAFFAHVLLDLLQVVADARHDLPAIAASAAKAQVARFQHDDIGDAFFGEFQRGIDAGETAANHHNIRFHILFKGREAEVVFFGCRVVGGRFDIDHGAAWKSEGKLNCRACKKLCTCWVVLSAFRRGRCLDSVCRRF